MLLTLLARRKRIVVFFLQPSAAASAAEPLNPTLGFPGRPTGPGSSLAGDVPGLLSLWALRYRAGPGASGGFDGGPTAAAGRPDLGMLGSARTVPTLQGHSLSAVSVCTVTAAAPRARSSGPGRADGTTPRRRRARLVGSLMAPRRFAALGLRPSFAPSIMYPGPGPGCRPHRRPEPQA
jgi:hypothetical protein